MPIHMALKSIRKLLLIENDAGHARLLGRMLTEDVSCDTELTHVESMVDAEKYLAANAVDVILLDLRLPDVRGVRAVQRAHELASRIPLIVLTELDDDWEATQALREGAQDFLIKGQINARGLVRSLRCAIERKTLEQAIYGEKERAQVTLNSIGEAIISTDASGNITFLNPAAERLTGWSRQEVVGVPVESVFQVADACIRQIILNLMAQEVGERAIGEEQAAATQPSNSILIRRDGFEIPIEDFLAPIHDLQGNVTGVVITFRDVSAAREMTLQMIHSAKHDFLTGLPNRMLFNDRVTQAVSAAQRHTKKVAVLFLDLDGFKHINDSLGHEVGDELLQSVAKRLVNCVRGSDTVSRRGGDEFVVLLSEVEHSADAAITARRMLDAVARYHPIGAHDLHITTSIGLSVYPDDGLNAESLIKNADTAMYQAKENGRQRFQFFKPAMNVRTLARQSIEGSLRQALERQELSLEYQPKINISSGEITGAEALVRWMHPTRGQLSPSEFIPIAEDCGLIHPIGKWVLREACRQARSWRDEGLSRISMAVNISAMEFRAHNFLESVFAILKETSLDPGLLELELTESALMKRAESNEFILNALRSAGIRLAIDDFGTGYSSLNYLRRFPIDALKIDQSFVRQIASVPAETTIVTAVIGMARSLNRKVSAGRGGPRKNFVLPAPPTKKGPATIFFPPGFLPIILEVRPRPPFLQPIPPDPLPQPLSQ